MSAVEEREVSLTPAQDLLPRVSSRDIAAFPMPHGREEVWRFTPLATFARVLAGDASDAHLTWDANLPEGVTLTELACGGPVRSRRSRCRWIGPPRWLWPMPVGPCACRSPRRPRLPSLSSCD